MLTLLVLHMLKREIPQKWRAYTIIKNLDKLNLDITKYHSKSIIKLIITIGLSVLLSQNVAGQNCPNLNPSFSYTITSGGCSSPDTITFINSSTGSSVSTSTFYWKINNTTFATTTGNTAPASLVKSAGNYNITLIGVSASSCSDTFTRSIQIQNSINPDFSILTDSICLGSAAFFTNTSSGTSANASYQWTFGTVSFSTNADTISYIFPTAGNHNVSLQITDGNCTQSITKNITIVSGRPPIRFYNNYGIPLQTVTWKRCLTLVTDPDSVLLVFASPDTLINYYFDFGDGNSIYGDTLLPYPSGQVSHTYQSTGVYDLIVTTNELNSCTRTFFGQVINLRYPVVGIGGPDNGHTNGCIPFVTAFKNTSSHVSTCTEFTWNYGDGTSETFDYTNANDSVYHNYLVSNCQLNVTLSATNSCGSTQTTWGPINAYTNDLAAITANSTVFCHPNTTISLQNVTQYNCYSGTKYFFWDFGDNSNTGWTNIGVGQSHTYTTPGNYTIVFSDSNLCGTDTASIQVKVYGPIEAGFIYSPSQLGCKNYMVSFTDTSIGDSLSYLWNFGDGQSSTLQNPIHTYSDTGTFIVSLEITGICGSSTAYDTIYVYKKPVAEIEPIISNCQALTVSYSNKSHDLSPFATYQWDLGNGFNSSIKNPNDIVFSTEGTYTVSLIVHDTCGIDTAQVNFVVYQKPTANFSADTNCAGADISFVNLSSLDTAYGSIVSYQWSFGDGNSSTLENPKHSYVNHGSFQVQLIAISNHGCSDTITKTITVKENPSVSFNVSPNNFTCNGSSLQFNGNATINSSSIDSFIWNFGDGSTAIGQNTSHGYSSYGNYNVTLKAVAANGCVAETNQSVSDFLPPQANFTMDSVCLGTTTHFQNLSSTTNAGSISSYNWDFDNDGTVDATSENPNYTYPSSGTYTAKLHIISQYGCEDSMVKSVLIYDPIQASFSFDTVCAGNATSFNDVSVQSSGNGTIASYLWTFGDGDSSSAQHPDHVFASSGNFQTSLTIQSNYGCLSSLTRTVLVKENPIVDFSTSPSQHVCNLSQIAFSGTASSSTSAIDSFIWSFGDGNAALGKNTTHAFQNYGNYDVTFTAKTTNGCSAQIIKQIDVMLPPQADFTTSSVCVGNSTQFTDQSTSFNNEKINSYGWDFNNDGIIDDTNRHTSYTYSQSGSFSAKLIVTTEYGCIDTIVKNIQVHPIPNVSFILSNTSNCLGQPVFFTNNSSNADSFIWNFGDQNVFYTQSTSPVSHSYSIDSSYETSLTAFNSFGCSHSITQNVIINPKPFADFSSPTYHSCVPFSINFQNNSIDADSFEWFVDGQFISNASTLANQNFYVPNDTIEVMLVAKNRYGCRADSIKKVYYTLNNPAPSFTMNTENGCGPLAISFTNTSANTTNYLWEFGDGTSSTLENPTHTYQASSYQDTSYIIKLYAYSSTSCIDSLFDTVLVYRSPEAGFTLSAENGCGPLTVAFTNTSTTNSALDYSWDFGNGISSSTTDTSIQYLASQTQDTTYTIVLTATNTNACSHQHSRSVTVYPNPDARFYASNASGCGPLNVSFVNNSIPNDTGSINDMSFVWDLGNGQSSTVENATTTYLASQTQDSVYSVNLTAYNEHGCADITSKTIRVYPKPSSSFSISQTSGCSPLNVSFTNTSSPNDTGSINNMNFFWSFGNGLHSNAVNANMNYFKSNIQDTNYSVELVAYSEHNCIDTFTQNITVYPTPRVDFSTSLSDGCGPLAVTFTNNSNPLDTGSIDIMSFNWNFGNGNNSQSKDASSVYQASSSNDSIYEVKLVGISEHGCMDSASHLIRVYPNPSVSFTASQTSGCGPLSVDFTNTSHPGDTSSINDMSFFWDFGNGTTSTTKDNRVSFDQSGTQDTTYTVILTAYTEHGCVGYDTLIITVYPDPIAQFSLNTQDGCSPLQINISNQSSPNNGGSINLMNFDWSFGNGDSSQLQSPSYTFVNTQNSVQNNVVSLTAYSEHGCVATYSETVSVKPSPEVSFYIADSVACQELTVNFINTTDPHDQAGINQMNFNWDFDNGITSNAKDTLVHFNGSSTGTANYTISLSATNAYGCQGSYQNNVSIFANPVADFNVVNTKNCGNDVVFTNTSLPNDNHSLSSMSFSWNFANQKVSSSIHDTVSFRQSHFQDTNLTISLVAVNTLGCSDTTSKTILVHPKPQISFDMSTNETCSGVEVHYLDKSSNVANRIWMFGDMQTDTAQNPTHAYQNNSPNAYLYHVKLYGESSYGCPGDTFTRNILVHPNQSAAIITSIDSGCAPLSVNFYNNSHNSSLFHWTVENNLISTNTNLTYTFPGSTLQDSVYTVRLIAQNGIGCIDTAVKQIKVYQRTVASFNLQSQSGCSPTQVSFQNQTSGATDYFWDLGNGQTSTSESPSTSYSNHLFQDLDFNVTLFAISARNCFDTASKRITVHPTPVASFSADKLQGCDPVVVNFTNQSIISDSFQWNFGDGVTSSLLNPAHAFRTGKNDTIYHVTLRVFSEHGCEHSFTKEIKVYASPKAKFSFETEGCAPVAAQFVDQSENAVFWNWNFGDGHTSSEKNPQHVYFTPGNYSVKLLVSNYLGCSDTLTLNRNVIVHEVPNADFIADKYYSEYPETTFHFTSTSPSGLVHNWSFGNDRVIKTTNSVDYTFRDTGVYMVTLAVSSPYCSDTTWKQVIIDPPYPKAGFVFDVDEGCMPLEVQFTDTSTMTSGWLWYFGDGTTSTERHPKHVYTEPGKFSVTLITTNTRGSDAEYKMNIINVHPKPSVYFETSPEVAYLPNARVDLVNLTVNGVRYEWYIDGEYYDSLENVSKMFYDAGKYDVMLVAESKYGCIDSLFVENAIRIDTMSQVWMPNAFTPNGDGLNDVFKPKGFGYSDLDFSFKIFNRWGEKIYESNDFDEGWNGTFRNQLCPNGIYVYQLAIKLASDEMKYLDGQVTLIR
jgi:gliding motility-associated-like protein